MALRRLAQANNAANSAAQSPRSPKLFSTGNSPASSLVVPSTPNTHSPVSLGLYRSPASTPSISSSVPFDWEAARSRRPPPYPTPLQNKRKSTGVAGSVPGTPAKRAVIRKKGIVERITSIPSTIAFEIALFPHNLPLPPPKISARIIGGIMHLSHLCVRVSRIRKVPDSDLGWEDMYREGEGEPWFDWTILVSTILIAGSMLNVFYLFTRIKLYRLHRQPDPVSSPNARFVSAQLDFEPSEPPSLASRIRSGAWYSFTCSWRFLLGMQLPASPRDIPGRTSRLQQLEVWTPGELETALFAVYSPAHSLLWMVTDSSNWVLTLIVMSIVGIQLNVMTYAFHTLLKDKEIIAAEVMNEYNQGFVYPRINPIRKDVAVMTHQSEVVNIWED